MMDQYEDESRAAVPLPRAIQQLAQDVVDKIAAGEVIQRPANAIKEMMENSLDAGARMIRIQLRDGGIKMLQIQDDGIGVQRADMPLLCTRHATSKLRAYEDLSAMTTFGFRGEALASISYVAAAMTVVSRTQDSDVAYRASYSSGELISPKPGQSSAPRPCAGSKGTMITAEDLFYNVPQRRRALKSAPDEYALALDVVSKYAVHYGGRGVGFSCKKSTANVVDLSVPSSSKTTTLEAISIIYGSNLAKMLHRLEKARDDALSFSVEGFVSGTKYNGKRSSFLLFINDRLVDCPSLRRAVLAIYATLLPKGGHPWVYLSLEMDPANLDVNVHPTKHEVHFLHEDEIVEVICSHVEKVLEGENASRSYATSQAILPSSMRYQSTAQVDRDKKREREREEEGVDLLDSASAPKARVLPSSQRAGYPQHMVRVDGRTRTLDSMGITVARPSSSSAASFDTLDTFVGSDEIEPSERHQPQERESTEEIARTQPLYSSQSRISSVYIPESTTDLASIKNFRAAVVKAAHYELKDVFRDHAFVGVADARKSLSMLQHGTKLYLVRYSLVLQELSYQLLLRQFGALGSLSLDSAPYIDDLVVVALAAESESSLTKRTSLGLDESAIAERVQSKLVEHADMLNEYFSIGIELCDDGRARLKTLPDVMNGRLSSGSRQETVHSPLIQVERIPSLVLRLATQVDYSLEKECFEGVLCELARAHVPWSSRADVESRAAAKRHEHDWQSAWTATMRYFLPSKQLSRRGAVRAVTSLPLLYSVFERC